MLNRPKKVCQNNLKGAKNEVQRSRASASFEIAPSPRFGISSRIGGFPELPPNQQCSNNVEQTARNHTAHEFIPIRVHSIIVGTLRAKNTYIIANHQHVVGIIRCVKWAFVSRVVAGVLVGSVLGLGTSAFLYAKGYSYLLNDPAACANCHAWTV
jgi:hypothetical protein